MAQIKGDIESKKNEIEGILARKDKIGNELDGTNNQISALKSKFELAQKEFQENRGHWEQIKDEHKGENQREHSLRQQQQMLENVIKEMTEKTSMMISARE